MPGDTYEKELEGLQAELVKLQAWMQATGARVLSLFEGQDAAGKGGTINVIREYMNPRTARNVALTKPTGTESGQWYYQRYVTHFPTAGEFVTFDRSWYNRAGVEPVMGFCTPEQHMRFLAETPHFEQLIVEDGIHLFKFWLNIGQEMQLKRFHDRRHSPLTNWKFSPMDVAGMGKWEEYAHMRDLMIERTHSVHAPWTVVRSNDKRRARLAVMRSILSALPYAGRDPEALGKQDEKIIGEGPGFLKERG
jgi:polyphosphate kinase 2